MFALGVKPLCLVPYPYSRFRYPTHPIYSYIGNLTIKTEKPANSWPNG